MRSLALTCTTHSYGGMEINVVRLATWLKERGNHILVVGATASPLLHAARQRNLPVCELPNPKRYADVRNARRLARALSERGVSIILTNSSRDINLAVLARLASRKTLRLIHLQHMQLAHSKKDFFHRWQHRHYQAWIAPLEAMARQVLQYTYFSRKDIHVIPLGIEVGRFSNNPLTRNQARNELNLTEEAFIAGMVGRFDRGKGQEYLLHAARMVQTEIPIHVLFVGEETKNEEQDYLRYLEHLAESLDLNGRVHFRPFREDIEVAYRAMDVFVLTSLAESYGMVTIEAMASGLPIIGTNTSGTPEIIEHDHTGLLIPPADGASLATALRRLYSDRLLRKRLGDEAAIEARRCFSHERQCENVERLLDGFSSA